MRRRMPCAAALTVAALAVFSGGASASGPAAPGKDVIQLNCEGLGDVMVSVPGSEQNNGAGQIVGAKGHGIGVEFTFTITDVTTDTVLESDSGAPGGGHAHPNQPTSTCSGVLFSAPASVFFEGRPLPPGVAPTDVIEFSLEGEVIIKL